MSLTCHCDIEMVFFADDLGGWNWDRVAHSNLY